MHVVKLLMRGLAPAAQDDSFLIIKEENCHNNPVPRHRSAQNPGRSAAIVALFVYSLCSLHLNWTEEL